MSTTLYKSDIVERLVDEFGFRPKDAALAIDETFKSIEAMLAEGHSVQLTGFGKFGTKSRPARTRKVFQEVREIPEATLATFKPGKTLRDAVNGGA